MDAGQTRHAAGGRRFIQFRSRQRGAIAVTTDFALLHHHSSRAIIATPTIRPTAATRDPHLLLALSINQLAPTV